jgi:acyl-CoA thioesterase YciA
MRIEDEMESKDLNLVTQHLVMNEHLNPNNVIFGGQLLAWLDTDVYLHVCNKMRFRSMVTATMNNVRFKSPANLGDLVQIYAKIIEIKKSSVTAMGKAISYYPESDTHRLIIECEITYVAVDKNGKPIKAFTPPPKDWTEKRNRDTFVLKD